MRQIRVQREITVNTLLNYAKAYFLFADPHRDCRFFYDLNAGHIIAHAPGMNYRVQANGLTFFRTDSGFEVPAPGCPFPRELATLNALLTFRRLFRPVMVGLLVVGALVVLQWLLWALPDSPADEYRTNFVALLSYWLNAALVVLSVFALVSACLYNFGHGISVRLTDKDKDTRLLSAGQTDIHPDIFLMSASADEDGQAYADRVEQAQVTRTRGQWIVVIPFRSPSGVVITGGEGCYSFHRAEPDYQGLDWHEEKRIVPPGFRFASETWAEYTAYCRTFAAHYPEWAQYEKTKTNNPVAAIVDAQRAKSITFEINEQ